MVSYELNAVRKAAKLNGLNPYCSGQWSRTCGRKFALRGEDDVLILIVVDNGLVLCEDSTSLISNRVS